MSKPDRRVNLLLDSGAYTAWNKGKPVDLEQYIRYCLENAEYIEKAVCLDVIPGSPGVRRTPAMVNAAAEQGWKNLQRMKRAGVESMPVFHKGEQWHFLDRMAAECEWIGLSSGSRMDGSDRYIWLDRCWSRLARRGEFPRVRVHGFSETRLDIMLGYPWYSVDSATWIKCGVYSQAFVPTKMDGRNILGLFFFGRGMAPPKDDYALFGKGQRRVVHGEKFFSALAPRVQDNIRKVVEAHGFTVEQLSDHDTGSEMRSAYNAVVMDRLLANHKLSPLGAVGGGLFFDTSGRRHGTTKPLNERVRFYAATTPGYDPLRRVNIRDRLLSFAFLKGKFDLGHYVRTGGAPKKKEAS